MKVNQKKSEKNKVKMGLFWITRGIKKKSGQCCYNKYIICFNFTVLPVFVPFFGTIYRVHFLLKKMFM